MTEPIAEPVSNRSTAKRHTFTATDVQKSVATRAKRALGMPASDEPIEKAYENSKQRWGEIERRFQEDISQARKGNAKKDSHLIRNLVVSAGVAHDKAYAKQVEAGMQLETPPIIIERMLILVQRPPVDSANPSTVQPQPVDCPHGKVTVDVLIPNNTVQSSALTSDES